MLSQAQRTASKNLHTKHFQSLSCLIRLFLDTHLECRDVDLLVNHQLTNVSIYEYKRELWKPSCKLLRVFQAVVTNHPICTVIQKAKEHFTAESLNFLTERWILVAYSST